MIVDKIEVALGSFERYADPSNVLRKGGLGTNRESLAKA